MQLIVFEDDQLSRLHPITIGRPGYAISCASFRLIDWLAQFSRRNRCPAAGSGAALFAADSGARLPADRPPPAHGRNTGPAGELAPGSVGRGPPFFAEADRWTGDRGRLSRRRAGGGDDRPARPAPPPDGEVEHWVKYLQNSLVGKLPESTARLPLFTYPHDVVRYHLEIIGESLAQRLESGRYQEVADGVFAAEGATLGQYVVTDTSKGPVLLDEGAAVGPYCFLRGPAYLGPKARVIEHSAIKDAVALGHTTKIGGEVEASIVEPYTNKQHHGFLGHSYLGSWINLGAGTCNSDLKNTYGTGEHGVSRRMVATGMQFVGCIMGDYAKTAINTGIFTGKTIGVLQHGLRLRDHQRAQLRQLCPAVRPGDRAAARSDDRHAAADVRPPQRRSSGPATSQLIHAMYDLTRPERQLAGEPLAL